MKEIPDDHPRAQSLRTRHMIIDGMHTKIVAEAGLIAHGRGEAFDYLFGEETNDFAIEAIKAAASSLYLSKLPILSVNGNVTALCPKEMVEFSNKTNIPMEINLFYRSKERLLAIQKHLEKFNPKTILGVDEKFSDTLDQLSSLRRIVDKRGIKVADTVFVPLEDGDRTEALIKSGKKVITVDLNPLSRTAKMADITIIDNIIRVFPLLLEAYEAINNSSEAVETLNKYNNNKILKKALNSINFDNF